MKKALNLEIELMGGLGNQLFQYFAGLKKAKELDIDLNLNSQNQWIHGSRHEKSEISDFKLAGTEIIENKNRFKIGKSLWRVDFFLLRKVYFYNLIMNKFGVITQQTFEKTDDNSRFFKSKLRLKGYFQDPKWFHELSVEDSKLVLRNESSWFKAQRERIAKPYVVVLHLRMGDYYLSKSGMTNLDISYYLESLRLISAKNPISEVIVFSDDIPAAQEFFSGIEPWDITYLSPPQDSPASESLLLMAAAPTLVIANSTFSLWAGLLGNPQKNVYFPSKWFSDLRISTIPCPEDWIQV